MFTVEQALLFLAGSGYDAQGHARMANEHNADAAHCAESGHHMSADAHRALAWAHAMLATDDGGAVDAACGRFRPSGRRLGEWPYNEGSEWQACATCGRMAGEHRTGGAL